MSLDIGNVCSSLDMYAISPLVEFFEVYDKWVSEGRPEYAQQRYTEETMSNIYGVYSKCRNAHVSLQILEKLFNGDINEESFNKQFSRVEWAQKTINFDKKRGQNADTDNFDALGKEALNDTRA